MPLREQLSGRFDYIQVSLWPSLEEVLGPLTANHKRVAAAIDMADIEACVSMARGGRGRKPENRLALARAFVAKAVLGLATTRMLIDRLEVDPRLRRLCGWTRCSEIPAEATFSRAFGEFAAARLPERVHKALIEQTLGTCLVGHVTRDATAIQAREKPVKVEPAKRCRRKVPPKRGEPGWDALSRLKRQQEMSLEEMLEELPRHCSVGRKPDAKGNTSYWIGYKLHLDIADGRIPVTAVLTSASLHDSQAAIPLAIMTAQRITHLYSLMDTAYDAREIEAKCIELGNVPLIAEQARSDKAKKERMETEARARRHANYKPAEAQRLALRSEAEGVNGRLKDEFGGRYVRVRGHAKVMCHLMFGILALTVDQLMRLVT